MSPCLSISTNCDDAGRSWFRKGISLPLGGRGLAFLAVFAFFYALAPQSAEAACGKGFVVMPSGYRGAVVTAMVAKHRKAYAEQTNQPRTPEPACTGPWCSDSPPAPGPNPLTPQKVKSTSEAAFGSIVASGDKETVAFVRDPDEAIYLFEVAPPPTPPPNSLLNWANI